MNCFIDISWLCYVFDSTMSIFKPKHLSTISPKPDLPDWFSSISSKAFASSVQSNATLLDWSVLMSYSSEYLTRKEVNHNLGTQELKKPKDLSGSYNTLKGKFLLSIKPQANLWFINWSHSGIRMRHNFCFNIYIWSYCVWDRKMNWNRSLY